MKKLLSIIILNLLFNSSAYADQRCTQERQDWIVHLKKQIEAETEGVKWKDDLCYASISHVKGIPIKEHLAIIDEENNEKNENLSANSFDLFTNDDLKPKDINWVPESFIQ